jgi:hypothetical protein
MGPTPAYESEPYDLARREERESAAADNRKRIGPAFKAMSHGDKDFNTCDEFKDGGLAPDDPFHKMQSQTFDKPFMPSGKRHTNPLGLFTLEKSGCTESCRLLLPHSYVQFSV